MLLSFTIENWTSFREPVTFSMIAGRERRHGERVPRLKKYKTMVLPIAAIYGGNASGKSNFFKAIYFARQFVLNGTMPDELIPIEPFLLDAEAIQRPSRFVFEIMIKETIYEYGFSVTKTRVLEEKLVEIGTTCEKILYHRRNGRNEIDKSIESSDSRFFDFVFRATRENQLFLTSSVFQNANEFRCVYDWFKTKLELIAPNAHFVALEQFYIKEHPWYNIMNTMLQSLDTGISRLNFEDVSFENSSIPGQLKIVLQKNIKEGESISLANNDNERLVVTKENGTLVVKKLVTYHTDTNGKAIKFEIYQESDGSIRLIDLLPAFIGASSRNTGSVYVIDEIDRSLHTLLTSRLINMYLASCSVESRSQMLLTTHDISLMDRRIFRRDEIWATDKDVSGNSILIPFCIYKDIRFDKDIRKSYLLGRMGGIPRIMLDNVLNTDAEKNEG